MSSAWEFPVTANTPSGYPCAVCGMWVGYGQAHLCQGPPRVAPPQPDQLLVALGRIEALLQRIAERLEAPGG